MYHISHPYAGSTTSHQNGHGYRLSAIFTLVHWRRMWREDASATRGIMRVSQRQVVLALLTISAIGAIISLIYQVVVPDQTISLVSIIIGVVVLVALLFAYWRGWSMARYITLIFITLLIGGTTNGVYLTEQFTTSAFLPPVFAMIIGGPLWIAGSALSLLVMLIVRAGGQGIYVAPLSILIYAMSVGGMLLARMVTDTAQRDAQESADSARQALIRTEAQAHELSQKAAELATRNEEQQRLLELVTTLETQTVSLADGVLLAPVVGHLDNRRAEALTRRLLSEVSMQDTRMVIIDIAGVPTVDTTIAHAILRTIQAVRLLGCEVTITGISASVATTMTQLGISMVGIRTARTPQEVISNNLMVAIKPLQN